LIGPCQQDWPPTVQGACSELVEVDAALDPLAPDLDLTLLPDFSVILFQLASMRLVASSAVMFLFITSARLLSSTLKYS
jgi:hypothetical protein